MNESHNRAIIFLLVLAVMLFGASTILTTFGFGVAAKFAVGLLCLMLFIAWASIVGIVARYGYGALAVMGSFIGWLFVIVGPVVFAIAIASAVMISR